MISKQINAVLVLVVVGTLAFASQSFAHDQDEHDDAGVIERILKHRRARDPQPEIRSPAYLAPAAGFSGRFPYPGLQRSD